MVDYYMLEDLDDIEQAQTFADLRVVAERILRRMPKPVAQVCGPISTGGFGSVDKNLEALRSAISDLRDSEVVVFSQIHFQDRMQDIKAKQPNGREQLLHDFYLPLFEKGLIQKLYFLRNWEASEGARWEHQQAERLGMEIIHL